jgi:hypothetical protein
MVAIPEEMIYRPTDMKSRKKSSSLILKGFKKGNNCAVRVY